MILVQHVGQIPSRNEHFNWGFQSGTTIVMNSFRNEMFKRYHVKKCKHSVWNRNEVEKNRTGMKLDPVSCKIGLMNTCFWCLFGLSIRLYIHTSFCMFTCVVYQYLCCVCMFMNVCVCVYIRASSCASVQCAFNERAAGLSSNQTLLWERKDFSNNKIKSNEKKPPSL